MENYKKTLLISVNEIKTESLISSNVDDNYISSSVITVQDIYLTDIIGTALYLKLQQLVYGEITSTSPKISDSDYAKYLELWEEYVKPYMKYKVTADILFNVTYKIRNQGVVKNSDTNVNTVSMDDIKYLEKQYSTYVDEYATRMSKFLCENKSSFGTEINATIPVYYDEAKVGNDFASDCGLWLGGNKRKRCR